MKGALDVHRELLTRDVPHEVVRLRRPVLYADDLPAALGVDACVAVRCYLVDGRKVAVLVASGAIPDPGSLLDALAARSLRVMTASEVNAATDYAAGLVSPFCLPADVELLADSSLGSVEVVYVPAGEGGVAIGIAATQLLRASGAKVATLTARPLDVLERQGWEGVGTDGRIDLSPLVPHPVPAADADLALGSRADPDRDWGLPAGGVAGVDAPAPRAPRGG